MVKYLCLPIKDLGLFRWLLNDKSRERETAVRLPDEVILNILVRLPVKDVVCFRSLSKSLCTTIDSRAFRDAYLNQSRTRGRKKLVVFGGGNHKSSGVECRVANLDDQVYNSIRLTNHPLGHAMNIVCSCNGLLLLQNPGVTVLWNPFTRRSMSVGCGAPGIPLCIGLGYDSATNNHKFVRIATHDYKLLKEELLSITVRGYDLFLPDQHYKLDYHLLEVRVFNAAATNSRGEVVQIPFQDAEIDLLSTVGVFVKGALHWIWRVGVCEQSPTSAADRTTQVLSLDISKQKFVQIYPPIPPRACHLSLHVLGGQLLLGERDRESVELYVADGDDDVGFTASWRKLFKLNLMQLNGMIGAGLDESKHVKFLDYSTNGNRVLFQYPANANGYPIHCFGEGKEEPTRGDLFWYDLKRGRFTFAYNPGMNFVYDASFCWESLASIPLLHDEPGKEEDENHELESFVPVSFLSSQSILFNTYKYVLPKSQVYS